MKLPKDVEKAIVEQDGKLKKSPGGNARKRVQYAKAARADATEEVEGDTKASKPATRRKRKKKEMKRKKTKD